MNMGAVQQIVPPNNSDATERGSILQGVLLRLVFAALLVFRNQTRPVCLLSERIQEFLRVLYMNNDVHDTHARGRGRK